MVHCKLLWRLIQPQYKSSEAAETICTFFWDPCCKTTAVSNKQLVCVGNSESKSSGLEDELEIRQESRRRRGSSQSQEASDLPNLLYFLLRSLRAARRRRRPLTSDNPPMTDRPTDWPASHIYLPLGEAWRSYTNITSWWAPQSTSKWITGWTRPALN